MEGQEITITYETLFELLRLEKNREEIQQLSPTFFEDVAKYVNEKQQLIDNASQRPSMFSSDRDTTLLENIKRLVKELYEKREKKILFMAINKSRTGSHIIDTSTLLPEEKELFEQLVSLFDKKRNEILMPLLQGNSIEKRQQTVEVHQETKLVKFVSAVPKFLGKELEIYGPFNEEDMANLPVEIAEVLIKKGRAVAL